MVALDAGEPAKHAGAPWSSGMTSARATDVERGAAEFLGAVLGASDDTTNRTHRTPTQTSTNQYVCYADFTSALAALSAAFGGASNPIAAAAAFTLPARPAFDDTVAVASHGLLAK